MTALNDIFFRIRTSPQLIYNIVGNFINIDCWRENISCILVANKLQHKWHVSGDATSYRYQYNGSELWKKACKTYDSENLEKALKVVKANKLVSVKKAAEMLKIKRTSQITWWSSRKSKSSNKNFTHYKLKDWICCVLCNLWVCVVCNKETKNPFYECENCEECI
jgi:hypothetical protein